MTAALLQDLAELVSIRSVSPDPSCERELRRAADWVANVIRRMGGTAEVLRGSSGVPLVIGEVRASRTPSRDVLAYAHFDVQPTGAPDLWESDPFELTERDGQLYARGVADDKANLVILLSAVEALVRTDALGVNVRFLVDGEEEVGGSSADEWLLEDSRGVAVALMVDGSVDALTTGIRGLMYGHATVTTGQSEQHSGFYGGAALSATDALIRAFAAVLPGADGLLPAPLRVGIAPPPTHEEEGWRELSSGVELLHEAGLRAADERAATDFHRRVRAEPALTIHGFASGHASEFAATIPIEAHANFSLRPVGGQSATELSESFEHLLREACPKEATLQVDWRFRYDGAAVPLAADELSIARTAIARHFGRPPAAIRSGASLPLFEALATRGTPVISTGFAIESEANMHGPNERFPRAHLEPGVAALQEILSRLGESSAL